MKLLACFNNIYEYLFSENTPLHPSLNIMELCPDTLWNTTLSWNTTNPNLTHCLQVSVELCLDPVEHHPHMEHNKPQPSTLSTGQCWAVSRSPVEHHPLMEHNKPKPSHSDYRSVLTYEHLHGYSKWQLFLSPFVLSQIFWIHYKVTYNLFFSQKIEENNKNISRILAEG